MAVTKASPVDIRRALMVANNLAQAGIDFVAIPVTSEAHKQELNALGASILAQLLKDAERDEGTTE